MNSRSERYRISEAGPEDAGQLLRLFECTDFRGGVEVRFTRRPDAYASLLSEGTDAVIPIVTDTRTGQVVGMGACIVRRAYVNGAPATVGYLTGMRVLPEYRMRIPLIPRVYRYLYECTRERVDLYYTTILADNAAVVRMLERRRPTMPEYRLVGPYTTYCIRSGQRPPGGGRGPGGRTCRLEAASLDELAGAYTRHAERTNLAPVDLRLPGLSDRDGYALVDPSGESVAACGIWNQQDVKQHIVTRYTGVYRALRRLPLQLLGYPPLPQVGTAAKHACVAGLTVTEHDPRLARRFLRHVAAAVAPRHDMILLGLAEDHPLRPAMAGLRSIRYRSRLYTVHWDNHGTALDGRPVQLEVGLL